MRPLSENYNELVLKVFPHLSYLTDQKSDDPNSAIADTGQSLVLSPAVARFSIVHKGAQILISNIQDTRNMLASMNLKKNIPVGNSDAGAYFNNKVLAAIDYGVRFPTNKTGLYPDPV